MTGKDVPKDQRKQIKNDLEALLNNYNPNSEQDAVIDQQLAIIQQAPPLDFAEMNAKYARQANNVTNSLLKYYVDAGLIDRIDFYKYKKEMDDSSLENIFFQLKSIRMAIEKIMEEINQGNAHPRLFEVFGQLHDKLANVVKMQANYILFLEDTYRKVKQELASGDSDVSETTGLHKKGDYYVTAGTKNIMKEIQVVTLPADEKKETRRLTHPSQKDEVLQEVGLGHLVVKVDESEEITRNDIDNSI